MFIIFICKFINIFFSFINYAPIQFVENFAMFQDAYYYYYWIDEQYDLYYFQL